MNAPTRRPGVDLRVGRQIPHRRLAALAVSDRLAPGRPAVAAGRWSGGFAGVVARPRLVAACIGLVAAAGATLSAGPVAGLFAAAYTGMAVRAWLRRRAERRAAAARTAAIDAVGALAAELRAGAPPVDALTEAIPALLSGFALDPWLDAVAAASPEALSEAGSRGGGDTVVVRATVLVLAAWRVGERLGAPLADLLDRVDEDLCAATRGQAGVAAQMAGVRATTWILAGLPAAGVALGYGVGGDPLHVLLYTRLGAGCALGALSLQCAGLAWTGRLCRGAVEELG